MSVESFSYVLCKLPEMHSIHHPPFTPCMMFFLCVCVRNGAELGDPCCCWPNCDLDLTLEISHPGHKSSSRSDYDSSQSKSSCDSVVVKIPVTGHDKYFVGSEEKKWKDFRIKNYTIPAKHDLQLDFVWSFPECEGQVKLYKKINHQRNILPDV